MARAQIGDCTHSVEMREEEIALAPGQVVYPGAAMYLQSVPVRKETEIIGPDVSFSENVGRRKGDWLLEAENITHRDDGLYDRESVWRFLRPWDTMLYYAVKVRALIRSKLLRPIASDAGRKILERQICPEIGAVIKKPGTDCTGAR